MRIAHSFFRRFLQTIQRLEEKKALKNYKKRGLKNGSIILCFHDVVLNKTKDNYAIVFDVFRKMVERHLEQFVELDGITKRKGIVLTFDDGYESIFSLVYPFLKEKGVPFTVFVATNFVGKEGYLSASQIGSLSEDPLCTIGSHMCSHRKTREMKNSEVAKEWRESKAILENITGKRVWHAALPYGSRASCSGKSANLALKCGYKTVANTIAKIYYKGSIVPRFVYRPDRRFIIF